MTIMLYLSIKREREGERGRERGGREKNEKRRIKEKRELKVFLKN